MGARFIRLNPFMAIYFLLFCNLQSPSAMCMQICGCQSTGTHSISEAQFCFVSTKHGAGLKPDDWRGIKEERYEIMGWSWTWKHAWSLPSIILSLLLSKEGEKEGEKRATVSKRIFLQNIHWYRGWFHAYADDHRTNVVTAAQQAFRSFNPLSIMSSNLQCHHWCWSICRDRSTLIPSCLPDLKSIW